MRKILKVIWNDSVGSKVIAAGIIFILAQIGLLIWGLITNIPFLDIYAKIFRSLQTCYCVKGWFLLILYVLIIGLSCWVLSFLLKKRNIQTSKKEATTTNVEIKTEDESRIINEAPTVFFHHRFTYAFPGIENKPLYLEKRKEIHQRLKVLLKEPTRFDEANGHGVTSDPIWWFRGGSALPISKFQILGRNKILLNFDEYIIDKLIAVKGRSYYQDYVYIQCLPDKPTGLYEIDSEILKEYEGEGREYTEEYGIFRGKLIKRQDYDDGATIIRGKPVETIGEAEIRVRTLTKFNFIITSKYSPYGGQEFDHNSEEYFNKLLKNEIEFNEFSDWMKKLPKNNNDY